MRVEFWHNQSISPTSLATTKCSKRRSNFSTATRPQNYAFVTLMTMLWQYICTQWETNQDRPRNSHPSLPPYVCSKEAIKHIFQYTRGLLEEVFTYSLKKRVFFPCYLYPKRKREAISVPNPKRPNKRTSKLDLASNSSWPYSRLIRMVAGRLASQLGV